MFDMSFDVIWYITFDVSFNETGPQITSGPSSENPNDCCGLKNRNHERSTLCRRQVAGTPAPLFYKCSPPF